MEQSTALSASPGHQREPRRVVGKRRLCEHNRRRTRVVNRSTIARKVIVGIRTIGRHGARHDRESATVGIANRTAIRCRRVPREEGILDRHQTAVVDRSAAAVCGVVEHADAGQGHGPITVDRTPIERSLIARKCRRIDQQGAGRSQEHRPAILLGHVRREGRVANIDRAVLIEDRATIRRLIRRKRAVIDRQDRRQFVEHRTAVRRRNVARQRAIGNHHRRGVVVVDTAAVTT